MEPPISELNDVKCLEHSTLKVPYELLNKRFRGTQKAIDREAAHVAQTGIEIEKLLSNSQISPFRISGSSSVDGEEGVVEMFTETEVRIDEIVSNEESNSDNSNSNSITDKSEESDEKAKKDRTTNINGREVSKLLGALADRLQSLKRKAQESIAEEIEAAEMVRKRVQHLKHFNANWKVEPSTSHLEVMDNSSHSLEVDDMAMTTNGQWRKTRLNRMLVDHLLREGMYDTANLLAESLNIKDLTNVDVFGAAKEVEESLRQHETHRMVLWCYENKSKLRKIHSTLELEIRVQEFVELVRKGKRLEAVKHARKYLAEAQDGNHITAVKKCMGLLAFPISSTTSAIHPYYDLLCDDRWTELVIHFRLDHARIYQLSPTSVLGMVVQAGLASLKTANCYRPTTKNPNCPVCSDPLSTLASVLPYAHCAHSQLVCAISGEALNENNPPMVLPSGFVYGTKSLREIAKANGGKVICPRSGLMYCHSEAERVFVM